MTTADTFFGATLAFTTQSSLVFDIISGGRSGLTIERIDTTHAGTSGQLKTSMAADLADAGTYEFEVVHDPNFDIDTYIGVSDTITITYPVPAGGSSGAIKAFTGHVSSYDETLPIDDRMTASIVLSIDSAISHTSST